VEPEDSEGESEIYTHWEVGPDGVPPQEGKMKKMSLVIGLAMLMTPLWGGCQEKNDQAPAGDEKALMGKKVVMIIAPQNFRDEELIEPQDVLTEEGAQVKTASSSLKVSKGMLGVQVKPDMLIGDIKPADWDAIILVGGAGANVYWEDSTVHSLVKAAVKENKIIGAICIAPVTLANAGILSGKKATVFASEEGKLKDKGAECTGQNVQRDGKVITANGPKAAREFGNAIAQALTERQHDAAADTASETSQ
jgi:protease I